MKNAVASAKSAMETVQRAVKQAADVAQTNFHAMADNALSGTKAASASKKR